MTVLLTTLSILLFTVSLLFVGAFATERYWHRTPFGQSVMVLAVAVGILALTGLIRTFAGTDFRGADVLLAMGRFLAIVAMTQRLVVLLKAQRNDDSRTN